MLCILCNKLKAYRKLNLVSTWDEDTGVFSFFLCSIGSVSCFRKFHPSSVTLGIFFLIFCEFFHVCYFNKYYVLNTDHFNAFITQAASFFDNVPEVEFGVAFTDMNLSRPVLKVDNRDHKCS